MTQDRQQMYKLGKYEVQREIGRGGFATVYIAHDTVLRRDIALKLLHPQLLSDPAFVTRFENDARATAQLDHPRIATLYELGHYEGRMYIALQLLSGGSLADRIKAHGRLPFADAARAIEDVAQALDYAHTAGFIHRDVKPGNILFNARGEAILTDFGLVKAAESSVVARSTMGGLIGTPAYMAPEIWEGQSDGAGVDVYALGCVLFEMLTGELLFTGATPPAMMRAHFQPHQYPASWPAGTPAAIETVLERALARALTDRYGSAGQLAIELRKLANLTVDDPLATSYQSLQVALAERRWQTAEELALLIMAQEPGYRNVRLLARQAAEGKVQKEQGVVAAQWREQALAAEKGGHADAARVAASKWLALAPNDSQAEALVQRLATNANQARPADQKPIPNGWPEEVSRTRGDREPAVQTEPVAQEPVVGRRGQVTSRLGAQVEPDPHPAADPRPGVTPTTLSAQTRRVSLLLFCAGWALAGVLLIVNIPSGSSHDLRFAWTSASLTGGVITAYSLRRVLPLLQWYHLLIIAASWLVSALAPNNDVPYTLLIGIAIGPSTIALVLRWADPTLEWKQVFLTLVGWAIGGGIGIAVVIFVSNANFSVPVIAMINWGVLGACYGAGGGAGILWLLRRLPVSARNVGTTAIPGRKAIGLFALTILGWTVAFVVTEAVVNVLIGSTSQDLVILSIFLWLLVGALGGATVALVLGYVHPSIRIKQIGVIIAAWSLGMGITWAPSVILVDRLLRTVFIWPSFAIICILMAIVGAIVTTRTVAHIYPALRRRQVLMIGFGWAAGFALAWMISLFNEQATLTYLSFRDIANFTGDPLLFFIKDWTIWARLGAVFGTIGGGVMFWQIYQPTDAIETRP